MRGGEDALNNQPTKGAISIAGIAEIACHRRTHFTAEDAKIAKKTIVADFADERGSRHKLAANERENTRSDSRSFFVRLWLAFSDLRLSALIRGKRGFASRADDGDVGGLITKIKARLLTAPFQISVAPCKSEVRFSASASFIGQRPSVVLFLRHLNLIDRRSGPL